MGTSDEEEDFSPSEEEEEDDDYDCGIVSVDNGKESDDDGEEEEESGTTEDVNVSSKTKKKKKRSKKDKKKGISSEEAKDLREKEHSLSSNLYKVQIDEILKEVSISPKRQEEVEAWFTEFKIFLHKCKSSKSLPMTEVHKLLSTVSLPLPKSSYIHVQEDSNEIVTWTAPTNVRMVGSWASNSAVRKVSAVDVVVELPEDFLRKSDYLGHRYHVKRAIYLAYLGKLIAARGDPVLFTTDQGSPIKPSLLLKYPHFSVKIGTCVPNKVFKSSRFCPTLNNLRYKQFYGECLPEDEPEPATPNYNFSILSDILYDQCEDTVHNVISSSENYKKALQLIKIWLHQRSLNQGYGAFTGYTAAAFLSYLSSSGKVDACMSAYEVLRVFFLNLSTMDWCTNGIGLCSEKSFETWHMQFDVVFLNESGDLNYTSNMSRWTFKRVSKEAGIAVSLMERNKISSFQSLFLSVVPFVQNFDHIIRIPVHIIKKLIQSQENKSCFLNHSGFHYPVIVSVVGGLMEDCFGSRVHLMDHELLQESTWELGMEAPCSKHSDFLQFGLVIARKTAYKLIEKCEGTDSLQIKTFKKLWGERSELRRFKDGTMCETVAFENKQQILLEMLSYIFKAHLNVDLVTLNGFSYSDCQVENAVERGIFKIQKLDKPKQITFIHGKRKKPRPSELQELIQLDVDTVSEAAISSFDGLAKTLRELEGLPLQITTVQGVSSVLRFTSFHPSPPQSFTFSKKSCQREEGSCTRLNPGTLQKVPKLVEPIVCVLHLETSGKWPDNVAAVDRLKAAFMIRIGQLLQDQFGLSIQARAKYLDIQKDGFIFRLTLTYYREITLLKQQLDADGTSKVHDTPESLRVEKETLLLPQMTSTLHAFHREYEVFGKACRLAKRWIASQLLLASPLQYTSTPRNMDCRFTEEAVECLVAYIFISHAPYISHPNEAQVGFLRFLSLLADTDWMTTPIILNFYDKLSQEDVSKIEMDFVRRRKQLPPLFIATFEDKMTSVWTKTLAPVILHRAKLLAKEALAILKNALLIPDPVSHAHQEGFEHRVKTAFRPQTSEFDIIIHLNKPMNPRYIDNIDSTTKPQFFEYGSSGKEEKVIPIVDFDPAQAYLAELRSSFGHLAIFLHDTFGGTFIAAVWKPDAFTEHSFSVSAINTRRTSSSESHTRLSVDVDEVIESIEILGAGLVERISRKT